MYCKSRNFKFPTCRRRGVEARFVGGAVSSNGGVLLLGQIDCKLGLCKAVARRLDDARQKGKIRHPLLDLLHQRVFSIAPGYEDLNDHQSLRDDPGLQIARSGAQAIPIRLKLFQTGSMITRNTRRVWFHRSSGCTDQELFYQVAARLKPR